MAVIRWGIIGVGNVTEVKSGPGFQKATNSALVAVMRRNGDLARDYAQRHNVPRWYDDADALINDAEVDAVYIATPPHVHKDYTLRCAAAGKPVYVEKPMALNLAECQTMVDACKAADVPLWVAFYRRALPRFVKIREIVQSGGVGDVRSVNMQIYAPPPTFPPDEIPWRLRPEIGGAGGRFIDLAPHMFDYLDYVLGPITAAQGMGVNHGKTYPADDHVIAHFAFESGAIGVGDWCFTAAHHVDRTQIIGTEGTISFACFDTSPVTITRGESVESLDLDNPPHVQQPLIQTMVDQLNGGEVCPSTGESALRTTWVTDQILGVSA
jgi:predicted dehydrogenase